MPAIQVGTVVDMTQADKLLASLATEVTDLRPVYFRIDQDVSQLLRDQFTSRGARLGTPWAPITDATQRIRIANRITSKQGRAKAAKAAGADTPLRDSGGLFSSFVNPGAPGSLRLIDQLEYQRGSTYSVNGFPVALAQQTGFKSVMAPVFDAEGDVFFVRRKFAKMVPARPIIPNELPAPVLSSWEGYIQQYIEQGTLS